MRRLMPRGVHECTGPSVRRSLAMLVVLAMGALGAVGCRPDGPSSSAPGACTCEAAPVDAALLAFLSKARSAHHRADGAEAQGDRKAAIAVLDTVTGGPHPTGRAEVDEVLADTRARLAELRAADGDFDRAAAEVQQGLELARDETYFRGHLFEVLGVVEEKRAATLTGRDDAAAAAARRRALTASEQAIEIQDRVLRRALGPEKP